MKLFLLHPAGGRTRLPDAEEGAQDVLAPGPCPACGAAVLRVGGANRRASKDDQAWEADALASCCRAQVGVLRLEMNTLFGVREDEAVLNRRVRVYT